MQCRFATSVLATCQRWQRVLVLRRAGQGRALGASRRSIYTADDAAQGTGNVPEVPIRTPSKEHRIVRGINGWSIIVHIGTSLWGQIAGPFRTRRDARNWTWGMAGSLMDRRW